MFSAVLKSVHIEFLLPIGLKPSSNLSLNSSADPALINAPSFSNKAYLLPLSSIMLEPSVFQSLDISCVTVGVGVVVSSGVANDSSLGKSALRAAKSAYLLCSNSDLSTPLNSSNSQPQIASAGLSVSVVVIQLSPCLAQ